MIKISIDVTKLDKNRFFKGDKGIYCDLLLIETPGSKYDDYMVKQGGKENRQDVSLRDIPVVGNGKKFKQPELSPEDLEAIPF